MFLLSSMLYAHMFNLQSPVPAQVPNITLASYSFRKRQALRFWRQALSKHFKFRTPGVRLHSLCLFTMGSCALTISKPLRRAQRCHRYAVCAKLCYPIGLNRRMSTARQMEQVTRWRLQVPPMYWTPPTARACLHWLVANTLIFRNLI
jgi:hypothetical protein